ncbi:MULTISPECIES: ImcF-related family protein [unclassified Enterobacter]|uniref:ImcF-related family protein n=1 Tax=unclassified Enterobacter TaxID=2608935 RepID=UPI00193A2F3F|nr:MULTISPECIES: ImcF-related family protein [unclassified Enterobacter]MBM1020221.1 type VI secretion protein VasK [Enterobacter sp. E1]MEA3561522.1 ImcF-related family protein [Enterobacter sp. GM-22]MEA3595182.1 ImcF-related family protein [Enterobacter sp. GM-31]
MINRFFNVSRITGVTLVMLLVALVSAGLLWWLGPHWQLTRQQQGLYWLALNALVCGALGVWRYRKQSEPDDVGEQTDTESVSDPQNNETRDTLTEIRDYLKHRYGLNWRNKVRFVVIAGHHRTANLAVPGIADAGWLEANNVVAVWGGSLLSGADSARIAVLRKLKRCAVSAVVLVYDGELRQAMQGDLIVRQLNERYKKLGWRAPLYLWEIQKSDWPQDGRETQPVGCLLAPHTTPPELVDTLKSLPDTLMAPGVQQGLMDHAHDFLLRLGWQLRNGMAERFHALGVSLLTCPYAVPLRGVMFSPPVYPKEGTDKQRWLPDNSWTAILDDLPGLKIQRAGMAWERMLYQAGLMVLGLTCAGVLFSWSANRHEITDAQQLAATARDTHRNTGDRLIALDALQRDMERLQYRSEHGVPWYNRFGQSQNDDLLARLWPEYARSALPLLRDATAARLRDTLTAWNALPADSDKRTKLSRNAYDWLKAWLMLNRPEKMDAAFFTSTVMTLWPRREGVAPGVWQYEGPQQLAFLAQNLSSHPDWKTPADPQLVSGTRSALLRLIGQRNAESALYQKMLQQVSRNYADMRLSDMTGDTDASRLFTTDEVVPGMFTREAWDNAVQPAIEKVVKERRDEIDWVLTDSKHQVASDISPEALKARLTERYFTDYAGAWLDFLNSLHWQNAATLSDAIDQLTMLADVRQSPLVALMNTLNIQGRAGQSQEALSDSLVKSAQNILHSDNAKAIDQQAGPHGPLDATFGPALALLSNQTGGSDSLSLQTFLTRVTRVRLKLQQVTNTADPQAMMQALAQTVFQGKSVDVTDTRDYGSLVAASLGQEWSGFGQALFVQPMEQAWQQVLAPTAESINSQWQQSIVNDWQHDFNDRWPLSPDKQSEASLPLLSQYLRNDTGRITQFVKISLGGVLHKEGRRWVPDAISSQGLHFNPEFLDALNALSELADVVFTGGDASVHFQLMGKPARDVMQTTLFLDQQKLDYHNQVESWQPYVWPDSQWKPRTTLTWTSVNTGERIFADYPGSWGFIRLLDKAQVKATDNSTYVLRWKTADGDTLNMMLRTEAGVGPLALLRLKGFRLPQQVFVATGEGNVDVSATATTRNSVRDMED